LADALRLREILVSANSYVVFLSYILDAFYILKLYAVITERKSFTCTMDNIN